MTESMLTTYRYGSPRSRNELMRIGAARHLPRGVRREDWQKRGYFDVWVPLLAPSAELVKAYKHGEISFAVFSRRYKAEMKGRESRQVIELLATMLPFQPISVGCFCEDEKRCHRSLLRGLIEKEAKARGAAFARCGEQHPGGDGGYASPACYAHLAEGRCEKT